MKLSIKLATAFAFFTRWMDSSLFFRGFSAVLNYIRALCGRGFIAQAFVGEIDPLNAHVNSSIFAKFISKLLNGFPKPLQPATHWHTRISTLFANSWLINNLCDHIGTPIPPPSKEAGQKEFWQWAFFAFPALGVAGILFAVPFLPTMMLGALLVPILLFIYFSRQFVVNSTVVFLFIFIIISALVAVMSLAPASSIRIFMLTTVFALSTLAIMAIADTKKTVDFLILIFVVSASFTGLVGLFQFFFGGRSALWLDPELFAHIQGRIGSSFGNPNIYAGYLLLILPITAVCVVFFRNMFIKICATGATGLLLINLALTYSRGAYVAMALAVIVFILLVEKRLLILMVFVAAILPPMLPQTVLDRILSIVNFADTSTMFRMSIWQGSLRMARDFWLSGVGQGLEAYHTVYPYYALAAAGTLHSHNLFLQIFVEVGVGGFIIFIAILACFFRELANFWRKTQEFRLKLMASAIMAGMIGFLVQSFFDYTFFNFSIILTFYLFIGLGLAFTRVYRHVVEIPQSPEDRLFISGY